MTTARDVARAMTKFMAEYGWIDDEDSESDTLGHYIAAALAERERATVERCCAAVCGMCTHPDLWNPAEFGKALDYGPSFWNHTATPNNTTEWSVRQCDAAAIRADAAGRETQDGAAALRALAGGETGRV